MPWLINSTEILHKDLMKLSTAAFLIFALHNLNAWKRPQIFPMFQTVFFRVRTGPGKPGKSWNFNMAFSRTGKSWKKATGPGKSWKFVTLG